MSYLILFEFKKIIKKRSFYISLLIGLVVCFIYLFMSFKGDSAFTKEIKLKTMTDNLQSINEAYAQMSNNNARPTSLNQIKLQIGYMEKMKTAVENDDWKNELIYQNEINKIEQKGVLNGSLLSPISANEYENMINKNEILILNNIKPINENFTVNGYNGVKLLLKNILILLTPIIISLIAGDLFSFEIDTKTCNFFYVQPLRKIKIFLIKILDNYFACILCLGGILFFSFIITGLIFGFGDKNYPIEYFKMNIVYFNTTLDLQKNIEFISIGNFIFQAFKFYSLYILFLISFCSLISNIFNNSIIAIAISILVNFCFYINNLSIKIFSSHAQYIPLTYMDIYNLINGNLANSFNNSFITYNFGVLILITSIIILLISSCTIFMKKEFNTSVA